MEEAAAQEGVGQLLLVVRGDDHDRTMRRADRLAGLVDEELHAVEFLQEVVGELDVGLVDLVDQQDDFFRRREGLPQFAALDVVGDVVEAVVAELAVAQAGDGVVFVEALLGLGRRLDVPFDQVEAEGGRHLAGELGLAGARLALEQQRPAQLEGEEDGGGEPAPRQIVLAGQHRQGFVDVGGSRHGGHVVQRASAFSTARLAITVTIAARYSAEPCRSLL